MKKPSLDYIPGKYRAYIREKAISAARTRIIVAGRTPEDFSPDDLEIVVKEEEDRIKGTYRDKGLLAVLALFGLSWF